MSFICGYCPETFEDDDDMWEHRAREHSGVTGLVPTDRAMPKAQGVGTNCTDPPGTGPSNPHKCPHCHVPAESQHQLKLHIEMRHRTPSQANDKELEAQFNEIRYMAPGPNGVQQYRLGDYFGPNPEARAAILAWHTALIHKDRAAASMSRLLNIKKLKAKARLAVYHEVTENWDKPGFKQYILTLWDNDLKLLERAKADLASHQKEKE